MSATFFLVRFLRLKESTAETRKLEKLESFLFNFKSSFRSRENQSFVFYIFKFPEVIKYLSIKEIKYIFLYNLESKNSLLMKFGQFISYYKGKTFVKIFYKNCDLETRPATRPFCVCKELITKTLLENELFVASYLY